MVNIILTQREIEVINKKLNCERISQLDSNVLTRAVRPKLRQIMRINAHYLLDRLSYNPISSVIERKIRNLILGDIKHVEAIILVGSVIQTSYRNYNDIDIIIVTKKRYWGNRYVNMKLCAYVKKKAKKYGLDLDVELISKNSFLAGYPYSPTLIYQLMDHKIIYGKINIPKKIKLSKLDLRMKLDWSDMENLESQAIDIYKAIRNTILVRLLMNKIIDNSRLKHELIEHLGIDLVNQLKGNKATKLEKRYALEYLNKLNEQTTQEIINAKWENIVI